MNIDWSKYPALPEPPELPEWRDTPEHEAYWEEVCDIKTPAGKKSGCLAGIILWLVLIAGSYVSFLRQYDWWNIVAAAGVLLIPAWIVWYIFFCVWFVILKRKISRKYGFSMQKLTRPDISLEIGKVLAARPEFDEDKFRSYWQNEEQADTAVEILKTANKYWHLHNKMLYPNDTLLLLFYGRELRFGKDKMIDEFHELFIDMHDDLDFLDKHFRDLGFVTLAELVESCLQKHSSQ